MTRKVTRYTTDQKIDACIIYAHKGTLRAVSKATGIPKQTLSDWAKSELWQETIATVRSANEDLYRARYAKIIDKATKLTLKKLPTASARDCLIIGATANDKLRLSMNMPTSISQSGSTNEQLKKVLDQCAAVADSLKEKRINSIQGQCKEIKK